ncbi:MAG TPA: tetratricopeptide repeat protein [Gaiellaceae bacterium]|nr:tetratricopeptide repeat protein [Gaiellaceae bacterium]
MARADRRQAARQARQVQRRPRAAGGGTQIAEDTMFFPRLRNHAKWVFVFLIVIFAGGFVFLGVGSGSAGLGDVLQGNWSDIFSSSSGSSAQIKKDQRLIKDNPKDYAAYKDLAAAQAADGKLDDAIVTLLQLKTANPKDVEGLSQLASIYVRKADVARVAAQVAQANAQTVVPQSTFAPAPTSAFGKAYSGFSAPISSAVEGKVNEQFQQAYSKMTSAYSQAVAAYQDVAKQSPSDASIQVALGQTAENAGDSKTAIAAYRQFLKLAPDDSLAPAVKARIKTLQQQPSVSTG